MTPAEAVRAATATGAKALRREDVGRIAVGLSADLVVLGGVAVAFVGVYMALVSVVYVVELAVVEPAVLLEQYRDYAPPQFDGRPYTPDHTLAGGETVSVAGIDFEVVAIPGHSPAHIAYYNDGHLFSGDLLFANSVGRVDLPGADWDTLLTSVRTLADRYPAETVIYPGHGPQTTLGRELERNPFLAELRA